MACEQAVPRGIPDRALVARSGLIAGPGDAALARATGVANVSGPVLTLAEHLATTRAVAGHGGEVVAVTPDWLEGHRVEPWSGDRSLPMWPPLPEHTGFMARSSAVARGLGLVTRPLADALRDTLEWELQQAPGRPRRAGLSPADERELVVAARAEHATG